MRFPIKLRRVVGPSMIPTYKDGDYIVAKSKFDLKVGDLVLAKRGDMEIIKRVTDINDDSVFIEGDNPGKSLDSRQLGWFHQSLITAKVVWPRS